MKLLSKTLARILGKEKETEDITMTGDAELIIFNEGDEYEFAECGSCGTEIEPETKLYEAGLEESPYPYFCPNCKKPFTRRMKAEEVQ